MKSLVGSFQKVVDYLSLPYIGEQIYLMEKLVRNVQFLLSSSDNTKLLCGSQNVSDVLTHQNNWRGNHWLFELFICNDDLSLG